MVTKIFLPSVHAVTVLIFFHITDKCSYNDIHILFSCPVLLRIVIDQSYYHRFDFCLGYLDCCGEAMAVCMLMYHAKFSTVLTVI